MILVDTSVWIDHINASDPFLVILLTEERVLAHSLDGGEERAAHHNRGLLKPGFAALIESL